MRNKSIPGRTSLHGSYNKYHFYAIFSALQLLHGGNVGRLDVVLDLGNLLLELVERDLGVLDDQVDLEHLDTCLLAFAS